MKKKYLLWQFINVLGIAFLITVAFAQIKAKSGDFDNSFGNNGSNFYSAENYFLASSMKIQANEKIVVGGSKAKMDGYTQFALARFNKNGSIDTTFGTNGLVLTDIISVNEELTQIAIQSDGKIVATGYGSFEGEFGGVTDDIIVVRYNSNGSLDTSFGDNGVVSTSIGIDSDTGNSVAIQSDGKIVVAGGSGNGLTAQIYDMVVVRYNSNGSLDTTFNSTGKKVISTSVFDYGKVVRLQSDGKILVGGETINNITSEQNDYDMTIARLNNDGSLDNSFGTNGIYTKTINVEDRLTDLQIDNDGKVIICGNTGDAITGIRSNTLLKLLSLGTEDLTFGNQGLVLTRVAQSSSAEKLLLQNNRIITTGYSYNFETGEFSVGLVKYKNNGKLDNSFGNKGIVNNFIDGTTGFGIEQQKDQKLVVLGIGSFGFSLSRYKN